MSTALYWHTITPLLKSSLHLLMGAPLFSPFRLVGGTALSLQLGHRLSVDIDMFSDVDYGTIDFDAIDQYLQKHFPYSDTDKSGIIGTGKSYFVGNNRDDSIKLDVYYTDTFIRPVVLQEHIRMASVEDIIAMKVDIISRGGRKKDFWDLHELLEQYPVTCMIRLHQERYPYSHDANNIHSKFLDFTYADEDFDPLCLKGKHWELIKLDFIEALS